MPATAGAESCELTRIDMGQLSVQFRRQYYNDICNDRCVRKTKEKA